MSILANGFRFVELVLAAASAVQLFGALTRPLTELAQEETTPPGITFPAAALLGRATANAGHALKPETSRGFREAARATAHQAEEEGWLVPQWAAAFRRTQSHDEEVTLLDIAASHVGPRIMQFVDDSISCQSTLGEVYAACRCLVAFVTRWQLEVAGQKKRPASWQSAGHLRLRNTSQK